MQSLEPLPGPQGLQGIRGRNGTVGETGDQGPAGNNFTACRMYNHTRKATELSTSVQTSNLHAAVILIFFFLINYSISVCNSQEADLRRLVPHPKHFPVTVKLVELLH